MKKTLAFFACGALLVTISGVMHINYTEVKALSSNGEDEKNTIKSNDTMSEIITDSSGEPYYKFGE